MRRAPSIVVALLLAACHAAPPGADGSTARPLVGTPRFGAPATWSRQAADGVRVTPRWLPGGALAAAGPGGEGLFLLGGASDTPAPLRPQPALDPELGVLLHDDGERRIFHHSYHGRITQVRPSGEVQELVRGGPWGVAVSPDGARIAFTTGPLSDPTLHLLDDGKGQRVLGRGAQPCWLPDGRHLVYAVPGRLDRRAGVSTFVDAELYLLDADTDAVLARTATPDRAEMEPAVAPDGRSVAFADWRDGTVWVAPLLWEVAP